MLTMKDISKRYELTSNQTRACWDAVSPLLVDYIERGPHNAVLVSEEAIFILDRMIELRRSGLSWSACGDKLKKEMTDSTENTPQTPPQLSTNENNLAPNAEIISIFKEQLDRKDEQIEELLAQLKDVQMRALPEHSEGRKSRWQYLKAVFTGR